MLCALTLAACATVGPDYAPPEPELPDTWQTAHAEDRSPAEAASWWEAFGDPLMTSLVKRALEGNKDVDAALARLNESRARLGMSEAARFPALDASASARTGSSGGRPTTETYSAGLDASWEIDLFGGTARAIEAARAELGARREALGHVHVTLAAEVALVYIQLRADQSRLASARSLVALLEEESSMVFARRSAGLASELDLTESREGLASARADVPPLEVRVHESMNRLSVLLGLHPGQLHAELSGPAPVPVPPAEIAVGVPADLLRRRPDIREAERRLAAATARVGVATAELYPSLTLTGSVGVEALSAGDLFSSGSEAWGVGPTLRWQVFRAGAIRRSIEAEGALVAGAMAAYEQTVLAALEDVENALVAYRKTAEKAGFLMQAHSEASQSERITAVMYRTGLKDYESLITARRRTASLSDRLILAKGETASAVASLFKALGGGWEPMDTEEPETP